jgi:hypothetical protein
MHYFFDVVPDSLRNYLACPAHLRGNAGHGYTPEQDIPIDKFHGQLAEVVEAGLLQQTEGANERKRIGTFNRIEVVIEIDEKGLAVARFYEAVGMPVKAGFQLLAPDIAQDVLGQDL